MRVSVVRGLPQHTARIMGTDDWVRVPISHDGCHIEPLLRLGLPARVGVHRPPHRPAMRLLTRDQVVSGAVSGFHQRRGRQHLARG